MNKFILEFIFKSKSKKSSFPRRRESSDFDVILDSRLRGNDSEFTFFNFECVHSKAGRSALHFVLFIYFSIFHLSPALAESCNESDGQYEGFNCCEVLNSDNPDTSGNDFANLEAHIDSFNVSDEDARKCTDTILFDESEIAIYKTSTVKYSNDEAGLIIGDADRDVVWSINGVATDKTILTVSDVQDVTLRNVRVTGDAAPLVACEKGGHGLTLEHLTIDNNPENSMVIDGCDRVIIHDLTVNDAPTGTEAVLIIKNSDTVEISGVATGNLFGTIGRPAIRFENVNNVQVSDLTVNDAAGNVLEFQDSTNVTIQDMTVKKAGGAIISMNGGTVLMIDGVTGTNLSGKGLIFEDVTGADDEQAQMKNISLQAEAGENRSDAISMTDVQNIELSGATVKNFGGDGVVVDGASRSVTLSGNAISDNDGRGIAILGDATSGVVTQNELSRNGDCGVYVFSTGLSEVSSNSLDENARLTLDGCAVGPTLLGFSQDDVSLLPISSGSFVLSVNESTLGDQSIYKVGVFINTSTQTGVSSAVRFLTLMPKPLVKTGKTSRGKQKTAYLISAGGSGAQAESLWSQLPVTVTGGIEDPYYVLAYNSSDQLIGVWTGNVEYTGSEACVTNPVSLEVNRIYVPGQDLDGDGLIDILEDKNMNCSQDAGETKADDPDTDVDGLLDGYLADVGGEDRDLDGKQDAGETDPNNADTDGDSIFDGLEDKNGDGNVDLFDGSGNAYETNALSTDTDLDGLTDDKEDLNLNGSVDSGETDPRLPDSDLDGVPDSTDACPMYAGQDCYYASCVANYDESGSVCDDPDDDGICSNFEDANDNCLRDAGELDANDADTDDDGLNDGIEDFNINGQQDSGETNPLLPDTDDDCIPDGLEDADKNGVYEVRAGADTSPLLTDSDGDGVADGAEDWNCNGAVDQGETDPRTADSDNDGVSDATDYCPFNADTQCVVRYCGMDTYADYDTDGDGLSDTYEDYNGDCRNDAYSEPSPLKTDTDADGIPDAQEICLGTSPIDADTDSDGMLDGDEITNNDCTFSQTDNETSALFYDGNTCSLHTRLKASAAAPLTPILILWAVLFASVLFIRQLVRKG